jgi:hypothetical protein
VVSSGEFRFYVNRALNPKEGDRVPGSGMLPLDRPPHSPR